jgi:hypothetical protein
MHARPARTLTELVLVFLVVASVFAVVWFGAPDLQPFLLVGGLAVTGLLYVGMYLVQRRRHW